jgi:ribonuclease HI
MQFIIFNIFLSNENNITESIFDLEILKETPFNAKIQTKLPSGKKDISYDLIITPVVQKPNQLTQEDILFIDRLKSKVISYSGISQDIVLYSIAKLFVNKHINLEKSNFSIDVIAVINDNYSMTYTDGSFKKDTSEASYGIVKILNENESGLYEDYTEKKYDYTTSSGKISEGTNNIGELTAIKMAIESFTDSKYQIIISDSEYGIKSFREWYYTWKDNGFKTYAKKPISNKDLILDTYQAIKNSGKIVFFKWIKGHSKKSFNELCDELAKNALDIKK